MKSIERETPIRLVDQIQYADGVLAKNIVIDNQALLVCLMAFDKGQGLGTHYAPSEIMVQVLEGAMDFTVEGKTHNLKAGDTIVLNAKSEHSLHAPERCKLMLTKPKL